MINQMKLKGLFFILLSLNFSVNILTAQKKSKKITVSGYVTDTCNNPLVGAMILIDKKNTQIHTDNSGYYKIRIRPEAKEITVLSQDNKIRSESIGGRTSINFSLRGSDAFRQIRQNEGESGESVDIGYRRMDSKKTAISVSKSDVLDVSGNEYSTYRNIYEMIQGRFPGVDVNGQKIRIRGANTLAGNNDPMFIVDGMPVNSIDHIIPNKVQSVTVLKGTATTIYGSRGVNGVIVITLKKNDPKTK
jgi:TonB-dependent SusC/RagA subfamily outer membrane receptor